MAFFHTFIDSVYNPGFYATMRERRTSSAIGHLFLLALLIAIAYTVVAFPGMGKVQTFISDLPRQVASMYPEPMVFSVHGGEASVTGVEEPVVISFPPEWGEAVKKDASSFIVIDTKNPFSIDAMKASHAAVYVAKDGIFSFKNDGQLQGEPYSKDANYTLTRSQVDEFVAKATPWLQYAKIVLLALIFIGILLGVFVGYTIFAFLVALPVLAYYAWFLKNPIPYFQAYRTTIYAMTLPLVLYEAVSLANIPFSIPFAFTCLTVAVVAWNTFDHKKHSAHA